MAPKANSRCHDARIQVGSLQIFSINQSIQYNNLPFQVVPNLTDHEENLPPGLLNSTIAQLWIQALNNGGESLLMKHLNIIKKQLKQIITMEFYTQI